MSQRVSGYKREDLDLYETPAWVTNALRPYMKKVRVVRDPAAGNLSMGHARALLALSTEADLRRLARDVIARSLSVRETESLVRKVAESDGRKRTERQAKPVDVHTRAAEDRLRLLFGTRVRIVRQAEKGRIEIDFGSENELIRIFDQLTGA